MNPQRDRGIRTELEACRVLESILGWPYQSVQRRVAEGTHSDPGDLIGLPDTTIQVSRVPDNPTAINNRARLKLADLALQQQRAATRHGVVLLRIDGAGRRPGVWRALVNGDGMRGLHPGDNWELKLYLSTKPQGWVIRHSPDTVTGGWHEITVGRYVATLEQWAADWKAATLTTTKETA